ncbi:MAG: lipoate--protein ligase family protein [Spirochaetales bacterium]|nr:lipoate--protein ligase family protein [Spirochaetales bacterium]
MGLDEAVLESVTSGAAKPTLRLYAWKPAAVSLGYFQGVRDEVDLDACAALGVDVVRRLTGGGAVYHADELTYSVVVPESHPLARGGILESYRSICAGVIAGLEELGVRAQFAPLNDIVSNGKKLSGNAQTRKHGCLLQHGTVLLGVDLDAMFTVLRVPSEKLRGKLIADVRARVSSVRSELGRTIPYEEAVVAFERGFGAAFGGLDDKTSPTPEELSSADLHAADRFESEAWTFKR